jgi:MFS family permease
MASPDFTLLWSASAASQLGNQCAVTANPLLALLLTHSPVVAGWVVAAGTAPRFLMYLPAGWLVDRVNRRRLMLIGQAGRLAACVFLLGGLLLGDRPTAVILAATFCDGAFLILYNAAELTAVQRVVNASKLPSALAMNEARIHLAVLGGKPMGGFLFGCGRILPYCLNMLTSLWSIIALGRMAERDYQPPAAAGARAEERAAGAAPSIRFAATRELLRSPFLRTMVAACMVGNFCFQIVLLSLVVAAEERHMSGTAIGLLLATSGVCGLAGSTVVPVVKTRIRDERNIITACLVAWALLTLVVALFAQPVVGLIAWGGLSVSGGFLNVATKLHQVRRVPAELLGRVIGLNRFLTSGAVPLGALSAGYIVARLHSQAAAWLVVAAITSMLVLSQFLLRPSMVLPDRLVDWLRMRLTPAMAAPFATPEIQDNPLG